MALFLAADGRTTQPDSIKSSAEFTFAMAQAQAALLSQDYSKGIQDSDLALRVKPADPRPNFFRAVSELGREPSDYDTALFYLVLRDAFVSGFARGTPST